MQNKIKLLVGSFILTIVIGTIISMDGFESFAQQAKPKRPEKTVKMPEVIRLGQKSKLGRVTFNHVKHNGGEYSADGQIQCIQCHHTAMPAADLASIPPFRTEWPAGRTTTLTIELFTDDPKNAGVASCRDCHARTGQKPKLLEKMPAIEDAETQQITLITNEVAFHTACDACHFDIGFRSAKTKAPSSTNCASCHKR